jgi:hypothetical protein
MATSKGSNIISDDTASDFGSIENKDLALHHYDDADGKAHLPGAKVKLPRAVALSLISGKRAKSA